MATACRLLFLLLVLALSGLTASAQAPTGTPPFGSFASGPDVIDLADLNVHLTVPVLHKSGRGTDFTYDLGYDSSVWSPVSSSGQPAWTPDPTWGWRVQSSALTGFVPIQDSSRFCRLPDGTRDQYPITNYQGYTDPGGTFHLALVTTTDGDSACDIPVPPMHTGSQQAVDGSGYTLTINELSDPSVVVTGRNGVQIDNPGGPSASIRDRNGNKLTTSVAGSTTTFTDTLNQPALTVSGSTVSPPVTYTYTAPSVPSVSFTVQYTTYTVQTNFGCGINDYGPIPNNLISEIDLPDGSKYTYTYETTPGDTHNPPYVTGRLATVTLPTGGTISYSYGINCSDGSAGGLTRQTPDGTWTYAQALGSGSASTTTITDPQNNQTVVQFQGIYETQRQVYQGLSTTGTLLQTTNTCYNGAASPCTSTALTLPINRRTETIQLGSSGPQCQHDYFYNNYGLQTQADDYDYGPSIGPLIKRVVTTYASLGNNIVDMPASITSCNGSGTDPSCNGTGTPVAQTTYAYDQTAVVSTSGTPQWTNVGSVRGNSTTIHSYTSISSYLSQTFTYFDTGNVQTATEINGVNNPQTTFTYNACGNSFPTRVDEPLSMYRSMTWNCTGGVMDSSTDENQQQTTITYNDPYFWRPASQNFPDGGQTSWTYNSPTSLTTTTKMNSTQNMVRTVLLDGLGRTSQTQLNSDPEGVVKTDTTYDALGRVATVKNPYRTTSDSTYGVTSYVYDALNRICVVVPPDGTAVSGSSCPTTQPTNDIFVTYSNSNNTATVTDQAGKKRQSTTDALGRVTQVFEDPAGANWETDYQYDALSNLLSVTQKGGTDSTQWRSRTFTYDFLSRLTSTTNPESGVVTYGYDANGYWGDLTSRVAPKPNQTGTATVTTTYSYDDLNRLTEKSYSDGTTLAASFSYDQTLVYGVNPQNPIGRLTSAVSANGFAAMAISYDPMGRIAHEWQCTPSSCAGTFFDLGFTYDLAGDLTSALNGEGVTIGYGYDGAARVSQVTNSVVDPQHPPTLATFDPSNGYWPTGSFRKVALGNGLYETAAYDNRLQPCRINVNATSTYTLTQCNDDLPTANVQDFNYGFNRGSSDNGNVMSWSATGQQSFNRTYSYDAVNRLHTLSSPSDPGGCTGLSWTYDAWGNRTAQTTTGGSCFQQPSTTFSPKNQLPPPTYAYDAAGNMTNDGSHTYYYDAENRLIQVDGTLGTCSTPAVCYTYDALGRRVRKGIPTDWREYLYDTAGNVFTEITGPNVGYTVGYVYANGALLAQFKNGTTYFAHTDHLGSTRVVTGLNQAVVQNLDYLPFGELNSSDSGITSHRFTGAEHDSESGLDHTWFRKYSSSLGRWMPPDPLGMAAADPGNPQSWNGYAYVLNNSVNLIDPTGLGGQLPNEPADNGAGWVLLFSGGSWFATGGHWEETPLNGVFNGEPIWVTDWTFNPSSVDALGGFFGFGRSDDTGGSWWGSFAKEFFKFSGGPGNVPTCAEQALKSMAFELVGMGPREPASPAVDTIAATGMKAASIKQAARAATYAASRTNSLHGTGLLCPNCSAVYRSMMSKAEFLGKASEAIGLVEVSFAAWNARSEVQGQARNGTCAAALPIF